MKWPWFDRYDWYARVLPVYMTLLPIALGFAAVLPQSFDSSLRWAAAVIFIPLAYLGSQIGADFGKRLEQKLWQQWGGAPTTRFLRNSNQKFNQITQKRVREKLRSLGLHVPSKDEEDRDPHAADVLYAACAEELIRRTRDSARFPLVFKGLMEYGFRRNLLGLKPLGLSISIVALLVCIGSALVGWNATKPPVVAISAALLTLGIFLIWLVWVNEKTVSLSASRYARFLLECALEEE